MKSHEIHTEFFFLSWLSSPELAKQVHSALTADTQQSKLQEGSDGDGGAWKSRDQQNRPARPSPAPRTAWVEGAWAPGGGASHPGAVLAGGDPGGSAGKPGC